MNRAINFFSEVRIELSKVTWPDRGDVIKLTSIVLAVSGILGLYVGGLDFLFTKVLSLVLSN